MALVGAVITELAFDEWFVGWMAGLFVDVAGGSAVARRRPDLADPSPAELSQRRQRELVAILVVATVAGVVIALVS